MLCLQRQSMFCMLVALLALAATPLAAQTAIDGLTSPRIMPLGDSITAGYGGAIGGYRAELGNRLHTAGYTFTYVGSQGTYNPTGATDLNHQGHSGWTTPQITAIVNGSFSANLTSADRIITTSNPDVVLLMIGTNDMIGTAGPTLNADYDTLISAIFAQKPTVRVIVLPMIYSQNFSPVQADNITYGGRNIQFINGVNIVTDRVRPSLVASVTAFQQAGRRITFFDGMNAVVTPTNCGDTAVLYDGIHPTSATYQGMGAAVVRAIQDVTPGAVAGSVVPTAPSGLIATANGNGFDLAWTTNSLNETGLQVEATTDPLFVANIISANAAAGANLATINGLQSNTTYYIRVKAVNGAGSSAATIPVRAISGNGSTTSQVSSPTFSPAAGTFSSAQSVSLSCATSGAAIHYTTDGSTPTAGSPTYSSALTVSTSATLKALATKDGMTDSGIASATYTITGTATLTQVRAHFGQQTGHTDWDATVDINNDGRVDAYDLHLVIRP